MGASLVDIGLYDADTDTLIRLLHEGDEIPLTDIAGRSLTIVAATPQTSPVFGQVESMFFDFNDGQKAQAENYAPYALFGDKRGDLKPGLESLLDIGDHAISIDLYSEDYLGGTKLGTVVCSFSVVADEGLVAYYPFNGNADDESGNGNHATVFGATPAEDRAGNPNSAYRFDGIDDGIRTPELSQLTGSEITLSAWVNADIGGNSDIQQIIESYNNNQEIEMETLGYGNSTSDRFEFRMGGDVLFSQYPLEFGSWHMVTGVYSPTEGTKIYIDDQLDNSGDIGDNVVRPTDFAIGRDDEGDHQYWKGLLDDVRIYNRALTSAEVEQLYNLSPPIQTEVSRIEGSFERHDSGDRRDAVLVTSFLSGPGEVDTVRFELPGDGSFDIGSEAEPDLSNFVGLTPDDVTVHFEDISGGARTVAFDFAPGSFDAGDSAGYFFDIDGDRGPGTEFSVLMSDDRMGSDLFVGPPDPERSSIVVEIPATMVTPGLNVGLYNADSDTLIRLIKEGDEIQLSEIMSAGLTIVAAVPDTSPVYGQVESMFFDFDDGLKTQAENYAPYALFGDKSGDLKPGLESLLGIGDHALSIDLFAEDMLGGAKLGTAVRNFTIVNDQPVSLDIGLYDADSDTLIRLLEDGAEIPHIEIADRNLTIVASVPETSPVHGQVDSMFFNFTSDIGQKTQTENYAPYALFGDRSGDPKPGLESLLAMGDNAISIDLYGQDGLRDYLGTVTLEFTLTDQLII